jgi:hypothetical protein
MRIFPVERDEDVKALRSRGLDPARKPQFVEQIAKRERRRAQHGRLVFPGRVEVEDADVRVVQVRRARRPHVLSDGVLIGHPEQRTQVGDERMVHDAVLLRHLDPLEPVGKPLRHVLLPETLPADARRVALHGDGAGADVRHHHRRDRLVVGGELALGNPSVWKQHLLRMRNHHVHFGHIL